VRSAGSRVGKLVTERDLVAVLHDQLSDVVTFEWHREPPGTVPSPKMQERENVASSFVDVDGPPATPVTIRDGP